VITSAMTCKKIIREKIDLKEIMTVLSVRQRGEAAIARRVESRKRRQRDGSRPLLRLAILERPGRMPAGLTPPFPRQ
jgi:hypothetical protein